MGTFEFVFGVALLLFLGALVTGLPLILVEERHPIGWRIIKKKEKIEKLHRFVLVNENSEDESARIYAETARLQLEAERDSLVVLQKKKTEETYRELMK